MGSNSIYPEWSLEVCDLRTAYILTIINCIAQGLAITAVNVPDSNEFFPDSFFRKDFGAEFEKLKIDGSTKGVHAFDVIARILKEPSLDNLQRVDEMLRYPTIISNHAETIKRYAEQWTMDLSIHEELERKIEELVWTVSVLYGAGGWAEGQEYSADFFLSVPRS